MSCVLITVSLLAGVLVVAIADGTSAPPASAAVNAFTTGDMFAGVANGSVLRFGSDGSSKGALTSGTSYEAGMCFDAGGNLYVTNFGNRNLTKFDVFGQLVARPWDKGNVFGGSPESCVVANNQHVFVGAVDPPGLREFDSNGNLLKTFPAAAQARGIDWIDLSGDQCTLLYTSEGSSIKAYDVCRNVQLNDFATNLGQHCLALRILHDGRVAVACYLDVVVLSRTGVVQTRYSASSMGDPSNTLFAFNVTPDNSAFWTADVFNGRIFKVRFSDGAVLVHVQGGLSGVFGLGVFGEGGPVGQPVQPSEFFGGGGLSGNNPHCNTGSPVDCATGNFWHTFTDLSVPGRGLPFNLSRTYNAQAAAQDSPFGHGWSSSYTDHLAIDPTSGDVTVVQENGSTAAFLSAGGGSYTTSPRVFATLLRNADGTYTFVRRHRDTFTFSATGQLLAERDLNGYTTTLSYDSGGLLTAATDPAGRKLAFTHDSTGRFSSASDPLGRTLLYRYDGTGNLVGVTDPAGGVWAFTYDTGHQMLTMTDPRGGRLTNVYNGSDQVTSQTDPLGRTTTFTYAPTDSGTRTTITSPKGNVTVEDYVAAELATLTKGAGTASAATWAFTYDQYTLGVIAVTDPNGHITKRTYDPEGNLTSVSDPLGRTSTMTYNSFDEPLTVIDPLGSATAYTYDVNGNLLSTSTPLVGTSLVQTTTYRHQDPAHPGDVTSLVDPNGQTWPFAYDSAGNRTRVTDPLGNMTTYTFDSIGRQTSLVSPKGNVSGANAGAFTTRYSFDALGDLTATTDPLGHVAIAVFDGDQNVIKSTDANGNITFNTYDADNELIATTRADGTVVKTGYDADGNIASQIDGSGATTTYSHDPLDRVVSTTDPLGRTTTYGYDGAGNRTSLVDPAGQTTSYAYDAANELKLVTYSDGTTPAVRYTYDADGQRTAMSDGTGTTSYTFDSLHRLTSTTDGAGHAVDYRYDLAGQLLGLTHPNGQIVNRAYDAAGHLTAVADWLGNTTHFGYDPNSNQTSEAYPNGITAGSSYNNADQLSAITDTKGGTNLASFAYTRDKLGQVISATPTAVPDNPHSYSYTHLNQLASDTGGTFGYDHADNLTKLTGGAVQSFDPANELTSVSSGITLIGTATDGNLVGLATTTTVALPSGIKAGDQILVSSVQSANCAVTPPAGFATVATATSGPSLLTDNKTVVFRRTATGSERSVTLSYSLLVPRVVTVAVYRGVDPAAPVDAVSTAGTLGGTTVTDPSVTTTVAGNRLVQFQGASTLLGSTWSPPSGMTEQVQKANLLLRTGGIADQTLVAVGPTGSRTATLSSAGGLSAVLIALRPTVTRFSYDSRGNRITTAAPGGGTVRLTYDQANRLTAYGTTGMYAYNGDGLRMAKTVGGTPTAFVWDIAQGLPLLLMDGSDNYIYGPGGQPIEKISGSTATYLHQDQQGSTRLLTNSSGSVVGAYTYGAYGTVAQHIGTATTTLQYNGQYTDAESSFEYLRARYYDSGTGQFLTRDPAAGVTRSPYRYVNGNPLNVNDPSGLLCNPFDANCQIQLPFGLCINNGNANCQGGDLPGGLCEAHNNPNCQPFVSIRRPDWSVFVVNGQAFGIAGEADLIVTADAVFVSAGGGGGGPAGLGTWGGGGWLGSPFDPAIPSTQAVDNFINKWTYVVSAQVIVPGGAYITNYSTGQTGYEFGVGAGIGISGVAQYAHQVACW